MYHELRKRGTTSLAKIKRRNGVARYPRCTGRRCRYGLPMDVALEIAILLGLFLLNGFFAMAEIAVVSSRRIKLQHMAEAGRRGAKQALALTDNPGRFLSAVQVGITLIGIFSGAYGGATLGVRLGPVLDRIPGVA